MSPELGKTWFRVAMFITVTAGLLLFFVTPGTAEFFITLFTLCIGLVFILIIAIIARKSR